MIARAIQGGRGSPKASRSSGALPALRAFARLPQDQQLGLLAYALKQGFFALPVYPWSLAGRTPTALFVSLSDPWPGDPEAGRAIMRGRFQFFGKPLQTPAPLWEPVGVDAAWAREINAFDWLRDLRTAGGDSARRCARELVTAWMDSNKGWNPIAWHPSTTGRRLANWLGHYAFFAASAEVAFRHRLLRHLNRQVRHLSRALPAGLAGADAIAAIKGLVSAGVCLPGNEASLQRGLALLARELPRQILPDGGQVERSPARHLAVLRDLIDLRATLHAGDIAVPPDLQAAIAQMTPMLRLFRHGDGGLALFNDSNELESWQVDMVLQRTDGPSRPLTTAPASGFQRLQAGRTLLLVDAGAPPPAGYDHHAHAGTLSLEMSVGRERLFVNCGAHAADGEWRRAQRSTAAHSTLVIGETNSSQISREGELGHRRARATARRDEADGSVWLDLGHDGYKSGFGLTHTRRLYLSANGEDLRGEDRMAGSGKADFALRFHLHPEVQASLAQGGNTALLRLPKGVGWRFRAKGGTMRLEPSVYLGREGVIRRSEQLVITGRCEGEGAAVQWALQREAKATSRR